MPINPSFFLISLRDKSKFSVFYGPALWTLGAFSSVFLNVPKHLFWAFFDISDEPLRGENKNTAALDTLRTAVFSIMFRVTGFEPAAS